ncbi:MAG: hypothetical protein M3315_10580, partial [Actinomycetota bacterium]|nr:hypothetical protein [Actinomycetota bacterium]
DEARQRLDKGPVRRQRPRPDLPVSPEPLKNYTETSTNDTLDLVRGITEFKACAARTGRAY